LTREITHLINAHIQSLHSKAAGPLKLEDAIRLDKGELPYPPSPQVIEAIASAASTINRYPEVLGDTLRAKLTEYTGTTTEQIIIGNGSDDLIELIVKVFLQPGDEVILPTPTFFIYDFATRVVGGVPVWVERSGDFGLDVEAILAKITPKTKILFIANPNNPTANLVPRQILVEILDRCDRIVVVDECYYEFCQETVVDLLPQYPHLIILRSLSKSFGLAGIRAGYGLSNPTTIDYLYRAAQLFPVNKLAIAAANAALEDQAYIRTNITKIHHDRGRLAQGLEKLGFLVYPSATNFLFVNTKPLGITSQALVQSLENQHIFVADFANKQGLDAYHFRTSVGTTRENELLLEKITKILLA